MLGGTFVAALISDIAPWMDAKEARDLRNQLADPSGYAVLRLAGEREPAKGKPSGTKTYVPADVPEDRDLAYFWTVGTAAVSGDNSSGVPIPGDDPGEFGNERIGLDPLVESANEAPVKRAKLVAESPTRPVGMVTTRDGARSERLPLSRQWEPIAHNQNCTKAHNSDIESAECAEW
jgi:hypothetical protein